MLLGETFPLLPGEQLALSERRETSLLRNPLRVWVSAVGSPRGLEGPLWDERDIARLARPNVGGALSTSPRGLEMGLNTGLEMVSKGREPLDLMGAVAKEKRGKWAKSLLKIPF